ncbi:MAG: hypothetical protein VCB43_16545 [Myxococcota bacterium]
MTYGGTALAPIAMAFGVVELTGSTSDSTIMIAYSFLAGTATVPILTALILVMALHAPAVNGFIIQLVDREDLHLGWEAFSSRTWLWVSRPSLAPGRRARSHLRTLRPSGVFLPET